MTCESAPKGALEDATEDATEDDPECCVFVYLLVCADDSFYCGITRNLATRMQQHNGVKHGGAKYTRGRRPVTLVYTEGPFRLKEAMARERAIKSLARTEKTLLVAQQ